MTGEGVLELPRTEDARLAWIFPGQGVQTVGMGLDLWKGSDAARSIYETVDRVIGYSLTDVCFNGPEDRLRLTEHTQPAILATSLACIAAAVESGRVETRPLVLAGHSIGEYVALIMAGAFTLEEGISLVDRRARLMAECSVEEPGTMAAILGLFESDVASICSRFDIDICLVNDATQIVVGGPIECMATAVKAIRKEGARVIELNVSGAFHSRLMEPAVEGMLEALATVKLRKPQIPVIANLTAFALNGPDATREELSRQVANPVRWHDSMLQMIGTGVGSFIEFGPGRMLTTMARRTFPDLTLVNISSLQSARGQLGPRSS